MVPPTAMLVLGVAAVATMVAKEGARIPQAQALVEAVVVPAMPILSISLGRF